MTRQIVKRNGKQFALVEVGELRRLERLAAQADATKAAEQTELPAWPKADSEGNRPAVEFARVSIARSIAEDRQAAGLSQQELARLAGVRQETISRIESGKHSPTVRTVEKIERILQAALKKAGRK
jgi:ribosome-binding protein aMBF1 (putative translation factor)